MGKKSAVSSSASSSTTTMRTSFHSDRYPDFRHYHSSDAGSRYYTKSAVSSSASSSTTTMRTSFRSDRYPDFRHYHSSDAGSRYYSTGSTGWLLGESYSLGRSHRAAATRLFDTEVAVERRNSVNKTNLRMDESLARSMSNVDAIRDLLNPKPPVEQGRRVKNASSRHWTSGLARPSDNVAATDSAPERRKGLKLKAQPRASNPGISSYQTAQTRPSSSKAIVIAPNPQRKTPNASNPGISSSRSAETKPSSSKAIMVAPNPERNTVKPDKALQLMQLAVAVGNFLVASQFCTIM